VTRSRLRAEAAAPAAAAGPRRSLNARSESLRTAARKGPETGMVIMMSHTSDSDTVTGMHSIFQVGRPALVSESEAAGRTAPAAAGSAGPTPRAVPGHHDVARRRVPLPSLSHGSDRDRHGDGVQVRVRVYCMRTSSSATTVRVTVLAQRRRHDQAQAAFLSGLGIEHCLGQAWSLDYPVDIPRPGPT
jgi:hypothetical protein